MAEQTTTDAAKGQGSRGPRPSTAEVNVLALWQVLEVGRTAEAPESRSQRRLFAMVMPQLYLLRRDGFSFPQITEMLTKGGLRLQPSTVRCYYNELLQEKQELCEARLTEHLMVLAEVEKAQPLPGVASRIAEIRARQQADAEAKVKAAFDATKGAKAPAATPPRPTPSTVAKAKKSPPPPAAAEPATEPEHGEFGLLAAADAGSVDIKPGAGYLNFEDEAAPQVPGVAVLGAAAPASPAPNPSATTALTSTGHLQCGKLQPGVPALEMRDDVPAEVYSDDLLEHPSIPGLMLTRAARLYNAQLEYIDGDGVVHTETFNDRRFRIKWKTPIPLAPTASMRAFTPTHPESLPATSC